MEHSTDSRRLLSARLIAATLLGLFAAVAGCQSTTTDDPRRSDRAGGETESRSGALGGSSQAYAFDNEEEGDADRPLPSYSERLALHLMNRFRLDPAEYGIQTMQGPVPPQLPMIGDPSLVEAGRWQARHVLDQAGEDGNCLCPQIQPQPESMTEGACCLPDSAEKACEITTESGCSGDARFAPVTGCGSAGCPLFEHKNTCCTMTRKSGKIQCQPHDEDITCGDKENATEEDRRWELLATGSASIVDELYQRATRQAGEAVPEIPGQLVACWAVGGCSPPTLALQPPQPFLDQDVSAMGIGQASGVMVPEECQPPEDTCDVGTCTDPATDANVCDEESNPECSGICKGEACDGRCVEDGEPVSCELPTPPDSEECQPSEYPKKYYISYVHGATRAPIPTLVDGIHYKLGQFTGAFTTTGSGQIGFGVHYFEPAGEAQSAEVVIDGSCESLSVEKRNVTTGMQATSGHLDGGVVADTDGGTNDASAIGTGDTSGVDTGGADTTAADTSGADTAGGDTSSSDTATTDTNGTDTGSTDTATSDAGGDAADAGGATNYWGLRYGTEADIETGCHRYVFSVTDATGFVTTYPRYGSLGAKIEMVETDDGMLKAPVANDEDCPIWSAERPDLSCLPEADQCVEGETRQCYTGRDKTRGKGICELGTEECVNGRWSGSCEGEVTPEPDETCGDDLDNDCNGFVDENCGPDSGGPDGGTSTDAGGGDAGPSGDGGSPGPGPSEGESDGDDDSGCGCATSDGHAPVAPTALLALGLLALRRRRSAPSGRR